MGTIVEEHRGAVLYWFTGKARQNAEGALNLLEESERRGQWIPGVSRKVRAALGNKHELRRARRSWVMRSAFTTFALGVLLAGAILAGCEVAPLPQPDSGATSVDPLVGTWRRCDGYTLVFGAGGAFTPGPSSSWAWTGGGTWSDSNGVVTVQDDGHDVYPAPYSVAGDGLTLPGPDGPLQEGSYRRTKESGQ